MSQLTIKHRTEYRYSQPVKFGRHRLVLRPREGHDIQVERMTLSIEPAHHIEWIRDVFGNSVAIVDFSEAAEQLVIDSQASILQLLPFPTERPHEPWQVPYPVAYDPLETQVAAAYQSPSFPEDANAVSEWLEEKFTNRNLQDAEALVQALGALVNGSIGYQRRMEKGVQTPAQTIELGTGSCRDQSTLLLDAARSLGVAARFASGYLNCPASEAGRAAMHAWVEFYLPMVGWRGYDATLGEATSQKHVVAGVSNHPRGVMPVSGKYTGRSSDYLGMTASVQIETG